MSRACPSKVATTIEGTFAAQVLKSKLVTEEGQAAVTIVAATFEPQLFSASSQFNL